MSNLSTVLATVLRSVVAGSTSDSADFWHIETLSIEMITAGSLEDTSTP